MNGKISFNFRAQDIKPLKLFKEITMAFTNTPDRRAHEKGQTYKK